MDWARFDQEAERLRLLNLLVWKDGKEVLRRDYDGEIRRKSADQVGKAQEILRQMEECTGPLWITGDGGGLLMEYAEKAGLSPLLAEGCRQNAAATALRAFQMAERGELTDCHHLTPSYLRLSQAERMKLQNK